jgi:hypothetical protein
MRQVVSLVAEGQVQYALVDDDSGEFTPFAIIELPHPEHFGLHEAAVLGTNLIQAIGLNGAKRPKSLANVSPTQRQAPEPEALPPVRESARDRRNRIARESYHANKHKSDRAHRSTKDTSKGGGAQRYVELDEVMAIVNQYPEGIRLTEVVERLWRETDGKGTDADYPGWFYTSCSNRLTAARVRLRKSGIPLPFREDDRPVPTKDGKFNGMTGKYLLPLPQETALPGYLPQASAAQQPFGISE